MFVIQVLVVVMVVEDIREQGQMDMFVVVGVEVEIELEDDFVDHLHEVIIAV
jgi:hypothetical protein